MIAQVNITYHLRPKVASRSVKRGGNSRRVRLDRGLRYHARERFIYLATNADRDVVKVGSSSNPKSRTSHMFLGSFVLPASEDAPSSIWRFRLAQSWSIGVVTYTQAIAVEYAVHRMLRAIAAQHVTEWYRLDVDRATDAIGRFLLAGRTEAA